MQRRKGPRVLINACSVRESLAHIVFVLFSAFPRITSYYLNNTIFSCAVRCDCAISPPVNAIKPVLTELHSCSVCFLLKLFRTLEKYGERRTTRRTTTQQQETCSIQAPLPLLVRAFAQIKNHTPTSTWCRCLLQCGEKNQRA